MIHSKLGAKIIEINRKEANSLGRQPTKLGLNLVCSFHFSFFSSSFLNTGRALKLFVVSARLFMLREPYQHSGEPEAGAMRASTHR